MILEQYYIECLSHASYLIGDQTTGRAVVVDPRRDITEYLDDATKYGLTIEGVINTLSRRLRLGTSRTGRRDRCVGRSHDG